MTKSIVRTFKKNRQNTYLKNNNHSIESIINKNDNGLRSKNTGRTVFLTKDRYNCRGTKGRLTLTVTLPHTQE